MERLRRENARVKSSKKKGGKVGVKKVPKLNLESTNIVSPPMRVILSKRNEPSDQENMNSNVGACIDLFKS